MTDTPTVRPRSSFRWVALVALALTVPAGFWAAKCMMPDEKPKAQPTAGGEMTVDGVTLFATWPQGVKPDVAIVVTGQTYGYLSPCGCSFPQKGGLERRALVFKELRAKGWPVVGVDLGDLAPEPRGKVAEQDALKYVTTMKALREMGYVGVGLGVKEFDHQLMTLLQRYSLQKGNEQPAVLSANLGFMGNRAGITAMNVEEYAVVDADRAASPKPLPHPAVGIASVIGPDVAAKVKAIDPAYTVTDVATALPPVVAAMKADPKKPAINVLLYAGSKDDTPKLAAAFRDFNVILCQSEESEPPGLPTVENNGRTFVIQIGHKGQNVGVIGVFKKGNGYELHYQLVKVGVEFITPDDAEAVKGNRALQLMEEYAAKVKKDNLLAEFTKKRVPHVAQVQNPAANLSYVGSAKCQSCHPNEFAVWDKSKHSHAMEALEKAKRPSNRNFDGDCVRCHTVGFDYQTGYTDDKATPQLRHVGCESCHGPGSGHVAQPKNAAFLASLSPWKTIPTDRLPAKDVLKKLAAEKPGDEPTPIKPAERQVLNAVRTACYRCHDQENDPKFTVEKYMPEIWHSGLKAVAPPAGGQAGNVAPAGGK